MRACHWVVLQASTQMLLAAAIAIRKASPVPFAARALRIGCAARPATLNAQSGTYVGPFHRNWFQPLVYQKLVAAVTAKQDCGVRACFH